MLKTVEPDGVAGYPQTAGHPYNRLSSSASEPAERPSRSRVESLLPPCEVLVESPCVELRVSQPEVRFQRTDLVLNFKGCTRKQDAATLVRSAVPDNTSN